MMVLSPYSNFTIETSAFWLLIKGNYEKRMEMSIFAVFKRFETLVKSREIPKT
jgi:hypothetical protein